MGCACINVSSKLVIKSNQIIKDKSKKLLEYQNENSKLELSKDATKTNPKNKNKDLAPILWLNIVDFLEYKDLKETRKINR
jgi:hypothetical protein